MKYYEAIGRIKELSLVYGFEFNLFYSIYQTNKSSILNKDDIHYLRSFGLETNNLNTIESIIIHNSSDLKGYCDSNLNTNINKMNAAYHRMGFEAENILNKIKCKCGALCKPIPPPNQKGR